MTICIIVFCITFATFGLVIARRRELTLSCDELLRLLYPHELEGLDDLIDSTLEIPIADLWKRTHGHRGRLHRYSNRTVMIRICQIRMLIDDVSPAEVEHLKNLSKKHLIATWKALGFGLIRILAPQKAARAVHSELQYYAQIAFWTHAQLADDIVPLCAYKLANLL